MINFVNNNIISETLHNKYNSFNYNFILESFSTCQILSYKHISLHINIYIVEKYVS